MVHCAAYAQKAPQINQNANQNQTNPNQQNKTNTKTANQKKPPKLCDKLS